MPYGPIPRHPYERFWTKVERGAPDECWEWRGNREPTGYGTLFAGPLYYTGRRFEKAHRLSWEIHNGTRVPDGAFICHHCDNRGCVNPNHLYAGTARTNADDREKRGRGRNSQGEASGLAKLTEDDVRAIIVELQRLPRRSQAAIAAEFGIKQAQVSRIMLRQAWQHIWKDET